MLSLVTTRKIIGKYHVWLMFVFAGCGTNTNDATAAKRNAAEIEKAVTDALADAGYNITYDFLESPSSQPTPQIQSQIDAHGVNYVGDPFYIGNAGKLTQLHLLEKLPSLHTVDLDNSNASDDDLSYLANLPSLRILFLNHTAIRGPGLKHLAATRIRSLHLKDAPLEKSAVPQLKRLTSLRHLYIYDNNRLTAADRQELETALPLCKIE